MKIRRLLSLALALAMLLSMAAPALADEAALELEAEDVFLLAEDSGEESVGEAGDIVIDDIFEEEQCAVYFDVEGESAGVQWVTPGSLASAPEAPAREGYVFIGWYNSDGEDYFANPAPITSDIILMARWAEEVPAEEEVQ